MKLTKKKVVTIALVVCLIAILSVGTLAWFTDDDSATNKFMIADSTDVDPDDIFSVDVWENTPEEDGDQNGAEYADILPGDQLKKEAYVENTGHYAQYIRVTVTISDAEAWITALGANYNAADLFVGFDQTKWTHIWNNLSELQAGDPIPENLVYVMYLKTPLDSGKKVNVFESVQIPTSLTQEQAAAFGGDFTIDIKAEAVQTENVGAESVPAEDAAWTAFKTVGM